VGVEAAHRQADPGLGDPAPAGRDQGHPVAVRIGEGTGLGEALPRQVELAVAGRLPGRDRLGIGVDLEHRAVGVMAVLVLAPPDGQEVIEGDPRLALPEGQDGLEVVGGHADVHARLGQLQLRLPLSFRPCGLARDPPP